MALQGTIDTFPLTDVLTLLAASAKTGRLSLTGDRGTGWLSVDEGAVVGGEIADRRVEQAARLVFELLRFNDGAFEFTSLDAEDLSGDDLEPTPLEDCVTEAQLLLEEWEEIEAVVPSLAHRVTLVAELPREQLVIDPSLWSLLVVAGRVPMVGAIAAELDLDEFAACAAIAGLVNEGLAEISDPEMPVDVQLPSRADVHDDPDSAEIGDRLDSYGTSTEIDLFSPRPDGADEEQDRRADEDPESQPPSFPHRFPIDDLVGEDGSENDDPWSSPEMEQLEAMRRADAAGYDEVSFSAMPLSHSGDGADLDDLAESQSDSSRSTAAAWNDMVEPDLREVGTSTRSEDDTADEVLRQMSKLSPKAAEAIAAALSTVPASAAPAVEEREDEEPEGPVSFLGSF